MILLRKPSSEFIAAYLRSQSTAPFSYDFQGATQSIPHAATPPDFVFDHRREKIGSGADAWKRAKQAVREWVMFKNGWTELHSQNREPKTGSAVAMQVWIAGLWWLNPCRVLYELDETVAGNKMKRFGFGYGTLLDHVERGEERFLVEQDAAGNVWYDLAAFSRPRHPLVRLSYPLARRIQLRFGRDSMLAMRKFVSSS